MTQPTLLLLAILSTTLLATGCSHQYIVAPDRLPEVYNNKVALQDAPGEPLRKRDITNLHIVKSLPNGQLTFIRPSPTEYADILRGHTAPDVEGIAYNLSMQPDIWEDYTIPGTFYGVGIGLAGVAIAFLVRDREENPIDNTVLTASGGIVLYTGLQGALWSSLIGWLATGGTTDMRLNP